MTTVAPEISLERFPEKHLLAFYERSNSMQTRRAYKRVVREFFRQFQWRHPSQITSEQIRGWRDQMTKARRKAEPGNEAHVGAPMPGVVSTLAVNAGQAVKAGDVLLSIEAMKMETALHAAERLHVGSVLINDTPGAQARTQGPVFEKSASVPLGLRAPTLTTGNVVELTGSAMAGVGSVCQGARAAGNCGRAVESLPAETTTITPSAPSAASSRRAVSTASESSTVSW